MRKLLARTLDLDPKVQNNLLEVMAWPSPGDKFRLFARPAPTRTPIG